MPSSRSRSRSRLRSVLATVALMTALACRRNSVDHGAKGAETASEMSDMPGGGRNAAPAVIADPALVAAFRSDLSRSGPTREVFARHLPSLGARPILDVLETSNPQCHGEAHELGRALFALRKDIGATLQECGTGCTSACMHGAVGEAFGNSDIQTIQAKMKDFCSTGVMRELHPAGNCAHGIGHALMFAAERNVDSALAGCRGFDATGMQYYCATGVYMELLLNAAKGAYPSGSHEPCDRHPEVSAACYRYRARLLVGELGGPDALLKSCLARPQPLRRGCFHGLGNSLLATIINDPPALSRYCSAGGPEDRVLCVEGAMEKQSDFNQGVARSICKQQESDIRPICEAAVANGMYATDKTTIGLYVDDRRATPATGGR